MPNDTPESSFQQIPYRVDALLCTNPSPTSTNAPTSPCILRLNASAIACPQIGFIEHGSIILKPIPTGYEIVAIGCCDEIDAKIASGELPNSMPEITLRDRVIMPALVNAHTHLDLTHIGPIAHDPGEGFSKWLDIIRAERKRDDTDIRHAMGLGIQASLDGGTIAVGDIAGAPDGRITDAPAIELAESPMVGVSYLEFFGIGKSEQSAMEQIEHYFTLTYPKSSNAIEHAGVRIGLQPHAPYTVGLAVYQWAAELARSRKVPLSTHLAETIEERMFIADGVGTHRDFLERFGVWEDSILEHIADGNHPVEHLAQVLASDQNQSPFLIAHVNDATDAAIEQLASTKTAVAYCPRGSAYFGTDQHFGPHRYQDMLASGVNVCLGTDSIVNLDTPNRISILDEMRFLHLRDGTDPKRLLQMATTNGARALDLDKSGFTLTGGNHPLGLIAVPIEAGCQDSWAGAMQSTEPPEWVFLREKKIQPT